MKHLFLIISFILVAGKLEAQSIAKNEPLAHEIAAPSVTPPGVTEYPSYKVICLQTKKNYSFEVLSPKSDRAEVKLMNTSGADICTIYKGIIHEGKNIFCMPSKKINQGAYYVVSKLSNGEQFADKVVITK